MRSRLESVCFAVLAVAIATAGLRAGEPGAGGPGDDPRRIHLDGSASADPGGAKLRYAWRQVAGPPVELGAADTSRPWFIPAGHGTYEFELRVSGGAEWSEPSRVRVIVRPKNSQPRADAGADVAARLGDEVLIDARRSADPDGDVITYRWRQISGPDLGLKPGGATGAVLSLKPPKTGSYVLELVVSDGDLESRPVRITVTVTERETPPPVARAGADIVVSRDLSGPREGAPGPNRAPVAKAECRGIVKLGETIVLDGSASFDPDGDRIRHFWVPRGGPRVRVLKPVDGGAKVSFKPREPGEYTFELTVSDGLIEAEPVTLRVRVHDGKIPVIADAGEDMACVVGEPVKLNGAGSGSSKKLSFLWKQLSGPRVTKFRLEDLQSTATPEFTPVVPGVYVFQLVVSDRTDTSLPDTVTVTVAQRNRSPELDVPAIIRAEPAQQVELAARATDPEGGKLEWSWKQTSGRARLLRWSDRTTPSPKVRARHPGKYLFEVTVSDGESAPSRALVALIVEKKPKQDEGEGEGEGRAEAGLDSLEPLAATSSPGKPVAKCPSTIRTRTGQVIALDAVGSRDPGGGELTCQWRQIAGEGLGLSAAELAGERIGLRFWRPGTWAFELVVTAGGRVSDPARVTVIVEE